MGDTNYKLLAELNRKPAKIRRNLSYIIAGIAFCWCVYNFLIPHTTVINDDDLVRSTGYTGLEVTTKFDLTAFIQYSFIFLIPLIYGLIGAHRQATLEKAAELESQEQKES